MSVEVYLTPKSEEKELPFTIVTGSNPEEFLLFSQAGKQIYRYPIEYDDGLLSIQDFSIFKESKDIVKEKLVGLSADYIEARETGIEAAADTIINEKRPGYGTKDIFVENKPFSLRQIVDLINENDLELSPDFQRNFVWDLTRQSRLIESIFLGLPLPSIYLSQYGDGKLTVVDGLQRLKTISNFLDNSLRLTNLEYFKNLEGKTYSQIGEEISELNYRRFGQTQIMCFVIDYRSPTQLKYDLFRRLNTGGKPLNNQEIRNCLSRAHLQEVIKNMISSGAFTKATNGSINDIRMDAREAALRFLLFYSDKNFINLYNGDMESSLDSYVDKANLMEKAQLEKYIKKYENALNNCYHLFRYYSFRKIYPDYLNYRRPQINKLLMLVMTVLLADVDKDYIHKNFSEEEVLPSFAKFLGTNDNLFQALSTGTNAKKNIVLAFDEINKYLKSISVIK